MIPMYFTECPDNLEIILSFIRPNFPCISKNILKKL